MYEGLLQENNNPQRDLNPRPKQYIECSATEPSTIELFHKYEQFLLHVEILLLRIYNSVDRFIPCGNKNENRSL